MNARICMFTSVGLHIGFGWRAGMMLQGEEQAGHALP